MTTPSYDREELDVLERMKKIMIEEDGMHPDDFEGMTFTDIESTFLDEFGHDDFRPEEN